MTDHFPGATKKVLSPAAQAVLDAFTKDYLAIAAELEAHQ
jgi:hypothetical protein